MQNQRMSCSFTYSYFALPKAYMEANERIKQNIAALGRPGGIYGGKGKSLAAKKKLKKQD